MCLFAHSFIAVSILINDLEEKLTQTAKKNHQHMRSSLLSYKLVSLLRAMQINYSFTMCQLHFSVPISTDLLNAVMIDMQANYLTQVLLTSENNSDIERECIITCIQTNDHLPGRFIVNLNKLYHPF